MDSVCSAYAYAALKNRLDPDNNYIAVRCGHLSDSCKKILSALDIIAPPFMANVYPKVSDVMLTSEGKHLEGSEPLTTIARDYDEANPSAIPIYENGEFSGLLTVDDIAKWYLGGISSQRDLSVTPSIREIMQPQAEPIQAEELFDEAKRRLKTSSRRGLAVFEGDSYVGYVTRRCFLHVPHYNVIMMDHNEPKQSIKGIEQANILEIIDHHRLDALKTTLPIFIDAEPLGSTCTIVYQLYVRNGLTPEPQTAKALLAGMMADTLVLKSPTTTGLDIISANALAAICNVDVHKFGREMFSHMEGLGRQDSKTAILADFKRYNEKGVNFGIGQCEVTTLHDVDEYKDKFLDALEDVRANGGLDWAVVMITDVLSEHSILLTTNYKAARNFAYTALEDRIYDMPGVLSRKKQLLPEMISTLSM